uniref:G-protein coupled receptors family 1 profile domain-containing protein n=1 Tax=Strongyloides stercoralis TaxID=6248 RepID=A0A0K0E959_STRER
MLWSLFNNHSNEVMIQDSRYLKTIFSKLSIFFIIIIGGITNIIIYILTKEYTNSRAICLINDLLPPALDYHKIAMPIALLCRSIEFSLIINFLQLFFSIVAIYASLKKRKILFIIVYNFIFVFIIFGSIFLVLVTIIAIKKLILKSTFTLFLTLFYNDDEFCLVIEPILNCKQYSIELIGENYFNLTKLHSSKDIIEIKCGIRSIDIKTSSNDCIEYLANVTLHNTWIIHLSIIYILFFIILIIQMLRFISCKNNNELFWNLVRSTRNSLQNTDVERKNNNIVYENNNNQNSSAQEMEMITFYLQDKTYINDENSDYL